MYPAERERQRSIEEARVMWWILMTLVAATIVFVALTMPQSGSWVDEEPRSGALSDQPAAPGS